MRWDIGIDLGTESVRMADGKQGPFKESAAALAFREGRDTPVYGGDAAEKLEGRVCEGIEIQRPLKDGVLENNFTADRMFHWIYRQADVLSRRRRFSMLLTCAPFARPVLRDAMISAAIDAGADCVALVRGDSAAAIGAGLDLDAPEAKLVVDIGAGKISATLFTLGRIASYGYLPYGMNRIDERSARHSPELRLSNRQIQRARNQTYAGHSASECRRIRRSDAYDGIQHFRTRSEGVRCGNQARAGSV